MGRGVARVLVFGGGEGNHSGRSCKNHDVQNSRVHETQRVLDRHPVHQERRSVILHSKLHARGDKDLSPQFGGLKISIPKHFSSVEEHHLGNASNGGAERALPGEEFSLSSQHQQAKDGGRRRPEA